MKSTNKKFKITLERKGIDGFLSNQSIGTDALNALQSIPKIENPSITHETQELVTLEYEYPIDEKFWHTEEILIKYGLAVYRKSYIK